MIGALRYRMHKSFWESSWFTKLFTLHPCPHYFLFWSNICVFGQLSSRTFIWHYIWPINEEDIQQNTPNAVWVSITIWFCSVPKPFTPDPRKWDTPGMPSFASGPLLQVRLLPFGLPTLHDEASHPEAKGNALSDLQSCRSVSSLTAVFWFCLNFDSSCFWDAITWAETCLILTRSSCISSIMVSKSFSGSSAEETAKIFAWRY